MAIMGSVDIPFTNSSKVAKGAEETAGQAQETANNAEKTANAANQTATVALQSADGKSTNYYGSIEPQNPKPGDNWFVEDDNGIVIAIKHWDGTKWVTDVDNTSINNAISKAQADAQSAINQANSAVNTANAATQNAQSAINQAQSAFDNAQDALKNAGDAIDTANALSVKVDENTGDISAIVQTTSSLTSRISTTEGNVSTLQQTANSFATRISNTEGNVSSLTQTVNGLQTQVSDNKGNISTVTQLANALQTRMTDAEGNISTLTQTSKSLQSTITSVRNDLDNLGGRNLVLNSNFADGLTNWRNWGSATGTRRTTTITDLAGFTTGFYFSADSTGEWGYAQDNVSVIKDETYILTAWIRVTNGTGLVEVQEGNGAFGWTRTTYDVTNMIGKWIRISHKFTAKDSFTGVYVGQATSSGFCSADVTGIKLEKGNKATDWTPAPEDQATQSQITQLANDINLRVKKNDVVNQINISTEGILIDGKKVHITGQTTIDNAVIKDAMIQNVSATKLTTGTLDANKVKVINLDAASISTGTLTGITINGATFNSTAPADNPYYTGTNTMVLQDSSMKLKQVLNGNPNINYTEVYTDEFRTLRQYNGSIASRVRIYSTAQIELEHFNGSTRDGYVTIYADSNGGTVSAKNIMAGGTSFAGYDNGNGVFTTARGYVVLRAGDNTSIVYLQGSEIRATAPSQASNYVNIRANSFLPPSSTRETKDDIVEFTRSVLGDIKNGKVYTYRYKWEEPDAFKRLGVMVDETPRILHGQVGDSIELYAFSAYLWKGVQELAAVTDNHSEELNILREQNENLILKIANLEMEMANIKQKLEAA